MRNDVRGPLLPGLAAQVPQPKDEWDMSLIEERNPQEACVNFSIDRIERAMDLFASVVEIGNGDQVTQTEDVGMLSQESRVTLDDILPAEDFEMPTFEELGLSQEQEQDGLMDVTKDDYDDYDDNQQDSGDDDESGRSGNSSVVFPQIEEQAMETVGEQIRPTDFLKAIREKCSVLEQIFRSGNFVNTQVNLSEHLRTFKDIRRSITREMATANGHNQGQEWVSTNASVARSNRRLKGAKFGLSHFQS